MTLDLLEPYVKREVRSFVRTTHFESQVPALFGQTSRTAAITSIDEGQRAIRKAQELVKEGESEKALAVLDELLRANPKLVSARLERAAIYNELKRYDESNADAAEAVKFEPKNPDLRLTGAWYGTYVYPGDGCAAVGAIPPLPRPEWLEDLAERQGAEDVRGGGTRLSSTPSAPGNTIPRRGSSSSPRLTMAPPG